MNNYFIILAAGKGSRFRSKIPKQYTIYNGKPLLQHSIDKAIKSKLFKKILVVINKNHKKYLNIKKSKKIVILTGGKERQDSSLKALSYLKRKKANKIFIHDAARPNFTIQLIKKLKRNLVKYKSVIPYINTESSTKYIKKNNVINLDRNKVLLTQTPQCFDYKVLYNLSKDNKINITDESSLLINKKLKIKFIKGESKNIKITTLNDIKNNNIKTYYGIGFDIHRLVKNKNLYLGGAKIPFHSGLKGHSDGDVILHSIIDSILGALRKKDIGTYFPNNKKFKNIRSPKMLNPIITILNKNNCFINNLDINLICERPKVSLYRNKILNSLSKLLSVNKNKINLKGKTVEKLGMIGKEKAMACEVIVSISKYE